MNHSNSWLLEGISCPALLLFLLTPLLKSWAGTRPSFDLDPEGDREEGLAKLRDRCETKRVTEIWDVSGRCLHTQTSDLVRYPSKCNISGGPYSNGNNLTPSVSLPWGCVLLGFKYILSRTDVHYVSANTNSYWISHIQKYVVFSNDLITHLFFKVDWRAIKLFMVKCTQLVR